MNGFLGVDTSCYTTSVAFLDGSGCLKADIRKPLEVKPGGRGLAQSEMVFQHTRNLPVLFEQLASEMGGKLPESIAIGVSARPRPLSDSYMPVFVAGESCARSIASAVGAPVFKLSHQENHILAGICSTGWPKQKSFLAVHLSGGTTEVLKISAGDTLSVEILGGSRDLHAGQFVDRIGVALGLPFPAGPHLEQLAASASHILTIPASYNGMYLSLSGPETHVMRLIERGADPAALAAGVQCCVAQSVAGIIRAAATQTKLHEIMVVGGVSANQYIRNYLRDDLASQGVTCLFPDNKYSSDNAIGAAYFAFWRCTNPIASA